MNGLEARLLLIAALMVAGSATASWAAPTDSNSQVGRIAALLRGDLALVNGSRPFDDAKSEPAGRPSTRGFQAFDALGRPQGSSIIKVLNEGELTPANRLLSLELKYMTINGRALFTEQPGVAASNWLAHYGYGDMAEIVALSGHADVGIVGASRTTDEPAGNGGSIGSMGWCFNFRASGKLVSCWGGYFEARRIEGSGGIQAVEINATDYGTAGTPTAHNILAFSSAALWLASGGNCQAIGYCGGKPPNVGIAKDASLAIGIIPNPTRFKRGIVIAENAITGCDGKGGAHTCTAIEVGRGAKLVWDDEGGREAALIASDVSAGGEALKMAFTDAGVVFQNARGVASLNVVVKSSDINSLQTHGSPSGSPARLLAVGEPNAPLALSASGSGPIVLESIPQFKASNTTGSAAVSLGANSPATRPAAPYTWLAAYASDGTRVMIPAWR